VWVLGDFDPDPKADDSRSGRAAEEVFEQVDD
jgi:hypothetical protein